MYGLDSRAGMMCNKTTQASRSVLPLQKDGTVDRMESRPIKLRGVPDVMEPCRRNEQIRIVDKAGGGLSLAYYSLNVLPPLRQRRRQVEASRVFSPADEVSAHAATVATHAFRPRRARARQYVFVPIRHHAELQVVH